MEKVSEFEELFHGIDNQQNNYTIRKYYKYNRLEGVNRGTDNCGKWLKFKRCDLCEAIHTPKSYLASVNDTVGCDQCPEHIKEKEDNKKINVVFGNDSTRI